MKQRTILFAILALQAAAALSQPDSLRISTMETLREQNHWLVGANPVALSMNNVHSLSVAEVTYIHRAGNEGNPMLPASTNCYAVGSESHRRLGIVSLYGKLNYELANRQRPNWNGMTPSTAPAAYANTCTRWSAATLCDSVSGNQRSERYELVGALSLPLDKYWLIGARFDYDVEQTAKDIDPRNRNQWMKWMLTPGIGYSHRGLRFGLSLLYLRQTEKVEYQHVGSHATYPVFVAYPLGFFGTLQNNEPIHWYYTGHEAGGALQMSFVCPRIRLFQQLSGSVIRQSVESNQVENRQESETEAWKLTYTARLTHFLPRARHEWAIQTDYHRWRSYDPLQRQEMGSPWQTYGRVIRSTRDEGFYRFTYGYYHLRNTWQPRFSVLSGFTFRPTESKLLFYPAEYTQPLYRLTADITLNQNIPLSGAALDLSVSGQYGIGGGSIQNEKQADGQTAPNIHLWQNTEWQQQVYHYETASRWQLNASLTYTHELVQPPLRWFARITAQYGRDAERLNQHPSSEIATQLGIFF